MLYVGVEMDDEQYYLAADLTVQCYKSGHIKQILFLAVPYCLIYGKISFILFVYWYIYILW